MKLSTTILYLVPVSPGTYFDPDDHKVIDKAGYIASRNVATNVYHIERDTWLEKYGAEGLMGTTEERAALRSIMAEHEGDSTNDAYLDAQERLAALIKPSEDAVRAQYASLTNIAKPPERPQSSEPDDPQLEAQKVLDQMDRDQPIPPTRTHRAMCKISLWPSIRRYKPGGALDDGLPPVPLEQRDGFRIREITKAVVSDYFGESDRQKRFERERLEDFVKEKRRRFGKKDLGFVPNYVFGAAVGAVGLSIMDPTYRVQMMDAVAGGLRSVF